MHDKYKLGMLVSSKKNHVQVKLLGKVMELSNTTKKAQY